MARLSFGVWGYRFKISNKQLVYKSAYGRSFTVATNDIDTATVNISKRGKGTLKVIGHGTTLAEVTLPLKWAEKARDFILSNIS